MIGSWSHAGAVVNVLKRLFGGRTLAPAPAPASSRLQAYLQTLTLDSPRQAFHATKASDMRFPAAVSTFVQHLGHKFATGYAETLHETSSSMGLPVPPMPFDAVAFEATAYIHYWLMQRELSYESIVGRHDDDDDEQEGDEVAPKDPYFDAMLDATHLSAGIMRHFVALQLPENFFVNRAGSYATAKHSAERFVQVLESTHLRGIPGPVQPAPADALALSTVATMHVGMFHTAYLETLPSNVRGLYAAALEGRL